MKISIYILLFFALITSASCGLYSLSGANVEGKTIFVHYIENNAGNVAPRLSSIITDKVRNKITSQTQLTNRANATADYDLSGQITTYNVSIASVSSADASAKNRLTISVEIKFDNNINKKNSWVQSFSKFADYPASQNLQSVENTLMDQICEDLADQIFTKAFVNW